jgi:hypothetical protein
MWAFASCDTTDAEAVARVGIPGIECAVLLANQAEIDGDLKSGARETEALEEQPRR